MGVMEASAGRLTGMTPRFDPESFRKLKIASEPILLEFGIDVDKFGRMIFRVSNSSRYNHSLGQSGIIIFQDNKGSTCRRE
jgi:hypothetical protein